MNPQERAVIDGIFDRLKSAASQPRDPEVERYIADLIRQQPYAPYAMAQSVYVMEQALTNQQQQIQQMQDHMAHMQGEIARLQQTQAAPKSGGFLSGLFGGGTQPAPQPMPAYGQRGPGGMPPQGMGMAPQGMGMAPQGMGMAPQPGMHPGMGQLNPGQHQPPAGPWGQPPQQRQGMGFLGTAAAAAAGVAGGMLLGSALSSAFGGGQANAAAAAANPSQFSPFGNEAAQPSDAGQGAAAQEQYDSQYDAGQDSGYDAGFDDGSSYEG